MTGLQGLSPLQYRVIGICFCINVLDGFDILALAYAAPAIGRQWQMAPDELGILFSLGLGGMMAGSILLAPLGDKFGRKPTILACLGAAAIAMLAAANAGSLISLGIARIFTGLAIGAILPCINTMVAEYSPRRLRTFAISVMQAGFAMGAAGGGFLAAYLLQAFGWPSVFLCGAVLTAAILPVVYFGLPESLAYLAGKPQRKAQRDAILARLGHHAEQLFGTTTVPEKDAGIEPTMRAYLVPLTLVSSVFFLSILSFYFLTSWVPEILVTKGMQQSDAVLAGALLTGGGLFSAVAVGWLSLRRSLKPIAIATTLSSAFLTIVFGILSTAPALVLTTAFVLGLSITAVQMCVYAIVPGLFPAAIRASATGIAIGVGRAGSVAGPLLAGIIIAQGGSNPVLFGIMAVPYLACAMLLPVVARWQRY